MPRNSDHVFDSYSSAIYLPTLIRLGPRLVMASFRLMKSLPAKYIVERAIARREIDFNSPIVETSSGTFALGLGVVCAEKGISFHIVGDAAISPELEARLRQLGGTVQIIGTGDCSGEASIQVLRLEALKERLRREPTCFWPQQYDNLDNQRSYAPFASQLLNTFGEDIVVVGSVGSGGSTCGTIKSLRETNPSIKLVGVDTFGSVLFGLPNGPRLLRGLGNSVMPGNLEHECFDEVHWVSPIDAFQHTHLLHRKFGLFCGPTTGATYQVARFLETTSNTTVIFTSPDEGYRYQHTVYNQEWLRENDCLDREVSEKPTTATSLDQVVEPWSRILWNRRSLAELVGQIRSQNSIVNQVSSGSMTTDKSSSGVSRLLE